MNREFWRYTVCFLTLAGLRPFIHAEDTVKKEARNASQLLIGKTAPKIWGWDGAGDFYPLSDWFEKSENLVLVELWSSKDKNRDDADKRILRLSKRFADNDRFQVMSLCIEADDFEVFATHDRAFRAKESDVFKDQKPPRRSQVIQCLADPNVVDPLDDESKLLRRTYEVNTTPSYYLLGPKRILLASKIDPKKLESVITDHLHASPLSP